MTNSRATAMNILLAWQRSREPLDLVLERHLGGQTPGEPRDAALVMAMVYGVLRWQGYLDGIIAALASHPLARMKPLTLAALRVGLYQLLFLDRVPASAAINETVQALSLARQPKWLTGFVNGLLRNAARRRDTLPAPDGAAAMASHPAWLVARWQQLFGRARTELLCSANNALPSLVLRVNSGRVAMADFLALLGERGIAALPGLFAPEAVRLPDFRGSVAELPGYGEGLFQVQDEAAQLVPLLLAPFRAGRYLDGCAGLGGKALHLAQLLPSGAELTAVEPSARRGGLLGENLQRQGMSGVIFFASTLEEFAAQGPGRFRGILLDAPCSGLGVIRRQPDIRWSRSMEELRRQQFRQSVLLAVAADLLEEGGILLYATCSLDPMENDEVVAAFLQGRPDFALTSAREYLPESARVLCDAEGFFRTSPEQGVDGFFAARMRKK